MTQVPTKLQFVHGKIFKCKTKSNPKERENKQTPHFLLAPSIVVVLLQISKINRLSVVSTTATDSLSLSMHTTPLREYTTEWKTPQRQLRQKLEAPVPVRRWGSIKQSAR